MRIRWDEDKRQIVWSERNIDFAQLSDLLHLPFIEDQKSDNPEQYRVTGFVKKELMTFIIEYREDHIGEYIWVVTAWKATRQEEKSYEKEIY